jgi:hypothetical protein
MIAPAAPSVLCLRQPSARPQGHPAPTVGAQAAGERAPHEEVYILCRACLHPIARPADRISVQGRHMHTFANPHGIVFEIGCFQSAPGCGAIGPTSDEFTWFPGHRWRVCVCAACLAHLGWLFAASDGHTFHGLILDRLIEPHL